MLGGVREGRYLFVEGDRGCLIEEDECCEEGGDVHCCVFI